MKRFITVFISILAVTVFFHPKPVCFLAHSGAFCGPNYPLGWLTSQPKFQSVKVRGESGPILKDISIGERLANPEVIFDAVIASAISFLTVLLYIFMKKRIPSVSAQKDVSVPAVSVLFISWIVVASLLAVPYYVRGPNTSNTTVIFKPIIGGME